MTDVGGLPGYLPDEPSATDPLPVDNTVSALAELLAARDARIVRPVGLLGPTGSGKSFAAWLVQNRLGQLSASARASDKASQYLSNIVQISFDARYSAGESPWVMLAEYIYDAVEAHRGGVSPNGWTRLLLNLPSVVRLHGAATSELNAATAVLKEAEREHRDLAASYSSLNSRRARLESTSTWKTVEGRLAQRLDPSQLASIENAGDRLGLSALSNRADLLNRLFEDMKSVGGTAGLLTDTRVIRRYLGSTLLVILAVMLAALSVAFGYVVLTNLTKLNDQVATVVAAFAGVSSIIGALGVLFAGIRQNQSARALRILQAQEQGFSEIVSDVETEHRRALLEVTEELERRRSELADSEARHAAARRSVTAAGSRLADLENGLSLSTIASTYRQADPGSRLAAAVRSDLEALSDLLCAEPSTDRVERIIVYVDGLDECDPQTTVETLNAVQEALAPPAFAAVVVADSRRLTASLSTWGVVPPQARSDGDADPAGVEYLVRLFQTYINLPRITSSEKSQLIAARFNEWEARESDFLSRIAPVIDSPSEVDRLVDAYRLAKALVGGPDAPLPLAMQAHLAVAVLAPASSSKYADALIDVHVSTLEELFEVLRTTQVLPDRIYQILEEYRCEASESDALGDFLQDAWIARRFAL